MSDTDPFAHLSPEERKQLARKVAFEMMEAEMINRLNQEIGNQVEQWQKQGLSQDEILAKLIEMRRELL